MMKINLFCNFYISVVLSLQMLQHCFIIIDSLHIHFHFDIWGLETVEVLHMPKKFRICDLSGLFIIVANFLE
jgi:hypothetical protein